MARMVCKSSFRREKPGHDPGFFLEKQIANAAPNSLAQEAFLFGKFVDRAFFGGGFGFARQPLHFHAGLRVFGQGLLEPLQCAEGGV